MTNRRFALLATVAARAFEANGSYTPTPADVDAARQARATGVSTPGDEMLKRSPDSAAMLEYWDLTDTLVDGINSLRLAGERYLPKFADEGSKEHQFRLKLTKLTNIYRDIIEGLSAKPFEQEIALIVDDANAIPTEIESFIEDVDGSGNNLTIFSAATFFNGINSAIDWIWVDYPKRDPSIVTLAQQKAAGVRPYWSHVLGRNILDVRSKVINGEETLTYLKIYEPGATDKVRIFERVETGEVTWRLYVKSDQPSLDGKTQFILEDEGNITIGVIPFVPFITGRRDGRSWRFFPAMRDAADLQIELYQQESGLKFAKTLTAYPMLAGNGITPPMEADGVTVKKIAVGPSRVLYAPPHASGTVGSWAYVEPNAQSLTFLAKDVEETIKQLRELGRQPLVATMGITVVQAGMAAGKAKSAVKAWGLGLKDALENALVITCLWMAISEVTYDPTVAVYLEFDEFLEGKDLDALQAARAGKDISQLTYWEELKRRAVLSPEFDAGVEEQRLLDELPGDGEDTGEPGDPLELPRQPVA
jgi:hypothetical protein